MVQEDGIQIRRANIYDWDEAIALAWKTFLKFEAKDYGQEGIDSFREFAPHVPERGLSCVYCP